MISSNRVYIVDLVDLVCLVYLVYFVPVNEERSTKNKELSG